MNTWRYAIDLRVANARATSESEKKKSNDDMRMLITVVVSA